MIALWLHNYLLRKLWSDGDKYALYALNNDFIREPVAFNTRKAVYPLIYHPQTYLNAVRLYYTCISGCSIFKQKNRSHLYESLLRASLLEPQSRCNSFIILFDTWFVLDQSN
jgi:hypothetical protein